jgi:hypothetical protein
MRCMNRRMGTSQAYKPITSEQAVTYVTDMLSICSLYRLWTVVSVMCSRPHASLTSSRYQDKIAWCKSTCRRVLSEEAWSRMRAITSPTLLERRLDSTFPESMKRCDLNIQSLFKYWTLKCPSLIEASCWCMLNLLTSIFRHWWTAILESHKIRSPEKWRR